MMQGGEKRASSLIWEALKWKTFIVSRTKLS
jgi:hypothetical protein